MDTLQRFENHKFMNVETYRKSGDVVRTPVWFVIEDGDLYFTTDPNSGKVKRMRNNPRVNVAPCKSNGELLGEWSPATARFPEAERLNEVKRIYIEKYNLEKDHFEKESNPFFVALKPA